MESAACIIPARWGSSRFEGKALAKIHGVPMILRVADICSCAVGRSNVFVATDDKRIEDIVKREFNCIMTGPCMTGADRVAEASKSISHELILSVQGDEPTLPVQVIKDAINFKYKHARWSIVNCMSKITNAKDSANTIKVVTANDGVLLYASRSIIPFQKNGSNLYKQVCISIYYKSQLQELFGYNGKKSKNEYCEDIDILRFVDHGYIVKMFEIDSKYEIQSVDVPYDVELVEDILSRRIRNDK